MNTNALLQRGCKRTNGPIDADLCHGSRDRRTPALPGARSCKAAEPIEKDSAAIVIHPTQRSSTPRCGTWTSFRFAPRPRTPDEIREFVLRLAKENSWGYTRILGELRKLGIKNISRQTVKVILKENDIDPGPKRGKGTWDEFQKIHADTLWQWGFVSKPMWTVKGLVDLYFLVFLHLGTRRCWITPCTLSPDSAWVSQQARNFVMEAEDLNLAPTHVMRDNDTKFTAQFDAAIESSGAKIKRSTLVSPNLRAHVERFNTPEAASLSSCHFFRSSSLGTPWAPWGYLAHNS